ncbi:MAG TPA: thioesterase family protein [Acidimicrobiia bacterium]|nr:thioesterase family protein [Acidimicrobiia bacterium]
MDFPVIYRRRVRYSDADAQKIVFNANYSVYFDDTLTDFLDAAGLGIDEMPARGYEIVLRRMELDFLGSARIGDEICVGMRFVRFGKTSMTARGQVWIEGNPEAPLVELNAIHVMVDAEHFQPVPIPDFVREAIEALQGPVGE